MAGDDFIWIGGISGSWNDASNWKDVTSGADPATLAPGANDRVTFNSSDSLYQVIGGSGDAATLTLNGDNIVTGTLSVGSLVGDGDLNIETGGTITAASANLGGAVDVAGSLTALLVGGDLVLESELYVDNGATAQLGSLSLNGGFIEVADTSAVEIGTAGDAVAGAIIVDAGVVVTVSSFGDLYGNLIDNGLITVSGGLNIGIGYGGGTLSGAGTIAVAADSLLELGQSVTGSLDIQLAGADNLLVAGVVGVGATINLSGAGNVLTLDSYQASGYVGGLPFFEYLPSTVQAAITGFNLTDAIIVDEGITITSAVYVAGSTAGTGSLVLSNGTITVSTLTLDGNYSGDNFLAVSISSGETEIVLSDTVGAGGTLTVPSGGTVSNPVVYTGGYETVEAGAVGNTPTIAGGTLELVAGGSIGGDISFSGTGGVLVIDPQGGITTIPANTLTGFTVGDTVQLAGVSFVGASSTFGAPGADSFTVAAAGTLTIDADGTDYNIFIAGVTVGQENFVLNGDLGVTEVTCYVEGTRIRTTRGEVAVEELAIGDCLPTLHAGVQKIKWIGTRSYEGRFIAGNERALPVCIKAGALSDGVPGRDLWVSPGHAICIDGALVHASRLVNGVSVVQAARVERVTYYHIELESHEIIFAENCPAESFMGESFRKQFHNAKEFEGLYPGEEAPSVMCLKRLDSGFGLAAIQRRIAARAGIAAVEQARGALRGYVDVRGPEMCSGWAQDVPQPDEPVCLDIFADNRRIGRVLANIYRADVREAGFGNGYHGFEFALPPGVCGAIDVRRAADGAALAMAEAVQALAA